MTLMQRFRIELGRSSNLQNCRIYDGKVIPLKTFNQLILNLFVIITI